MRRKTIKRIMLVTLKRKIVLLKNNADFLYTIVYLFNKFIIIVYLSIFILLVID
jgi:hypothetical protein